MGINILHRRCHTNSSPDVVAPNPSPDNFEIMDVFNYTSAYVLVVKYTGCTNYEGLKIIVIEGEYSKPERLDPHFSKTGLDIIARFKPSSKGLHLANQLAQSL